MSGFPTFLPIFYREYRSRGPRNYFDGSGVHNPKSIRMLISDHKYLKYIRFPIRFPVKFSIKLPAKVPVKVLLRFPLKVPPKFSLKLPVKHIFL